MTNDTNLLRVRDIEVKGLFRLYNHHVELKLKDRVTILHGANGVGKTVLLRLIAALFSGRFTEFARVPFERFTVHLTDGSRVSVESDESPKKRKGIELFLTDTHGHRREKKIEIDPARLSKQIARLESALPWLSRIGADLWLDERSGDQLNTGDIFARYIDFIPRGTQEFQIFQEPDWFTALRHRVNVHLIEAQRLFRMESVESRPYPPRARRMTPTVLDYAKDLQRQINDTMAKYASESQALDQSFPQRLLQGAGKTLPVDELKKRMQELEAKRDQLKKIGLVHKSLEYPFDVTALENLEQTKNSVMTLYVQDTAQKLGVLDDLARRVELLLDNVNGKFKHKSIYIDRSKGFVAIDHDGQLLDLESLSSGEQHELVLLYDLLFRVKPNTLVLIDEPELSLHLSWQRRFLPELLEIVQTANFDVLIATHSPFIVGDRSDLMVALDAEVE